MFKNILTKIFQRLKLAFRETENQKLKYEIIEDDARANDFTHAKLYRIRALKNFSDLKRGDLGGYVENESNLSQFGNCWIYDNACVLSFSTVCENAKIRDSAIIRDGSSIYGNAEVSGTAIVEMYSSVLGTAKISDKALVTNCVLVRGSARVSGNSFIRGSSIVE